MSIVNKPIFNPEEDESDYLPVGAHLLPQEFREFLYRWNKTISDTTGGWLGEPRRLFEKTYPDFWRQVLDENKRLSKLYPKELAALKAYQKEWQEENAD
jgi:hypothetical protein